MVGDGAKWRQIRRNFASSPMGMMESRKMVNQVFSELHNGFETACINGEFSSSLAFKPQFVSNDSREGRKVLSSIEDELLKCEHFQMSVAFITMGGKHRFFKHYRSWSKKV